MKKVFVSYRREDNLKTVLASICGLIKP